MYSCPCYILCVLYRCLRTGPTPSPHFHPYHASYCRCQNIQTTLPLTPHLHPSYLPTVYRIRGMQTLLQYWMSIIFLKKICQKSLIIFRGWGGVGGSAQSSNAYVLNELDLGLYNYMVNFDRLHCFFWMLGLFVMIYMYVNSSNTYILLKF